MSQTGKKLLAVGLVVLLSIYLGMAIKTQRLMQARLEVEVKKKELKAPEFDQKLQQIFLFNILLNPSLVFTRTD